MSNQVSKVSLVSQLNHFASTVVSLFGEKYNTLGIDQMRCHATQKCSDLLEWKMELTEQLQPAKSKEKMCTLFLVTNLDKSEWLSVGCNEKKLNSIWCSVQNVTKQNQVHASDLQIICPVESVMKEQSCYSFISKRLSLNASTQKRRKQQNYPSTIILDLVKAIKVRFPPVILLASTDHYIKLSFVKFTQTVIHKQEKYHISLKEFRTSGLFLHQSVAQNFVAGTNIFLCRSKKYISALFLCNVIMDCGEDDKFR